MYSHKMWMIIVGMWITSVDNMFVFRGLHVNKLMINVTFCRTIDILVEGRHMKTGCYCG